MGRIELFQFVPFGAEVLQVFTVLVKLKDVIAGITVGQKNIAVGSHRDGGRAKGGKLQSRCFGKPEPQNNFAAMCVKFNSLGIGIAGPINEFAVFFSTDFHIVKLGIAVSEIFLDYLAVW